MIRLYFTRKSEVIKLFSSKKVNRKVAERVAGGASMYFTWMFLLMAGLTVSAAGAEIAVTFPGKPFEYTATRLETTPEYEVYRLQYPSPKPSSFKEAKDVIAYYYKPTRLSGKPAPAVLCLHILGGNGDITKLIASYFAGRGMPALMPLMPLFLERVPAIGRSRALAAPGGGRLLGEVFNQIPGDIRKSIDLLASFPEVDSSRINLVGTSWGGILAVSAAGSDPRIDKAAFLLAGGDLQSIMNRNTKESRPIANAIKSASPADREYIDRAIAGIEPMNYASALVSKGKAGKIRMINAAEDEVIPPENSRRLAEAIGLTEKRDFIVLPGLSHYSAIAALPKLLDDLAEYFGGDVIAPLPERPATADSEVVKQVFSDVNAFLRWDPPAGKALRISARFESFRKDKLEYSGFVTLLRGPEGRFLFKLEDAAGLGEVDNLRFGRGNTPGCNPGIARCSPARCCRKTARIWSCFFLPDYGYSSRREFCCRNLSPPAAAWIHWKSL